MLQLALAKSMTAVSGEQQFPVNDGGLASLVALNSFLWSTLCRIQEKAAAPVAVLGSPLACLALGPMGFLEQVRKIHSDKQWEEPSWIIDFNKTFPCLEADFGYSCTLVQNRATVVCLFVSRQSKLHLWKQSLRLLRCHLDIRVGDWTRRHYICIWLCQGTEVLPVRCLPAILESSVIPWCVPEREVSPGERWLGRGDLAETSQSASSVIFPLLKQAWVQNLSPGILLVCALSNLGCNRKWWVS